MRDINPSHSQPLTLIDMAVRVITSELDEGRSYKASDLYDLYTDHCRAWGFAPQHRVSFGHAMRRYGATPFLTNSNVGRCWHLPARYEDSQPASPLPA